MAFSSFLRGVGKNFLNGAGAPDRTGRIEGRFMAPLD
jgi:hypothetical protein